MSWSSTTMLAPASGFPRFESVILPLMVLRSPWPDSVSLKSSWAKTKLKRTVTVIKN